MTRREGFGILNAMSETKKSTSATERWGKMLSDPIAKNNFMRSRSQAYKDQHPLAVWRCHLSVNLMDSELAELVGVTRNTVSNWQNGISKPTTGAKTKLAKLADSYGVPLDLEWSY